jgi:hypothetical protein
VCVGTRIWSAIACFGLLAACGSEDDTAGTGGSAGTGGGQDAGLDSQSDSSAGDSADGAEDVTTESGSGGDSGGDVNVDAPPPGPDSVLATTISVSIGHGRCGHLTIKLQGPTGTIATLMSRPGAIEGTDDGSGALDGALAGMTPEYSVSFDDAAPFFAENMGADFNGGSICKNGGQICEFAPDPGSALGPNTLAEAFGGTSAVGDWTLCVGDSVAASTGKFVSWKLSLELPGGPLNASGQSGAVIVDDGYDGTLESMACNTVSVTLPP